MAHHENTQWQIMGNTAYSGFDYSNQSRNIFFEVSIDQSFNDWNTLVSWNVVSMFNVVVMIRQIGLNQGAIHLNVFTKTT